MRLDATRRVFGVALLVPMLTFLAPAPIVLPALAAADAPLSDELDDPDPLALGEVPAVGPLDGSEYDAGLYDPALYDAGFGLGYDDGFDGGFDDGFDDGTLPAETLTTPDDDGYQQGYDDGYAQGQEDARTGTGTPPADNTDGNSGDEDPDPDGEGDGGEVVIPPGDYVPPEPPNTDPMVGITVDGNQITRGGVPWWFAGYNSFVWSGDCGHDYERMTAAQVDSWFRSMRRDGHGAVRLFFYDGWDISRLDAAVASARKWNVYLTITLDDAIGGCGENDKTASWFSNASETATFENHMRYLLERYRGETAIAWFEYFNEPGGKGTSGQLRAFYDRMGAIAADVDPTRLFSSGTVAPYWLGGEANFRNVASSPGVDISSLHEYDFTEIESNHGDDVRENSARKPVIVGEFGMYAGPRNCVNNVGGDGKRGGAASFAARAEVFRRKLAVYTGPGYVGGFAWAWQPGGSGCEYGNLDADLPSQQVFRTIRPGAGGSPVLLLGPVAPTAPVPTAPAAGGPAAPVGTPTPGPTPTPSPTPVPTRTPPPTTTPPTATPTPSPTPVPTTSAPPTTGDDEESDADESTPEPDPNPEDPNPEDDPSTGDTATGDTAAATTSPIG